MKVNKSSSSTVREEHQENSLRPAASQVRAGRALPLVFSTDQQFMSGVWLKRLHGSSDFGLIELSKLVKSFDRSTEIQSVELATTSVSNSNF